MASSDLIKWATSNGKPLKHYASAFLALFSITSLLGCDMFQEKIFQPMPEPPIIEEQLTGYWEIVAIDGASIQTVIDAHYADWYFDGDGGWEVYVEWDYGALQVHATIHGAYTLDDDFFIFTIPEDDGFFELEPNESLIKGTVLFEGDNRLILREQNDEIVFELERIITEGYIYLDE